MTASQENLYPNNVVLRIGEPSVFGLSESPGLFGSDASEMSPAQAG